MQKEDTMPLLQVRECPEDIYRKIMYAAKVENRTIAQQTVVLLEKGLGQQETNMSRRKNLLDRIQKRRIPEEIKAVDAALLVRKDRDR